MKVKGVDVERRGQTKKKEIGGGLPYTATAEEVDVDRPKTVTAYLVAMAMYMLALAIWGSKPRDPQPAEEESRETDPVDYVYFPYQHSLDYVHRANKFVVEALAELSAPQVFTMLRKRDEEERTMWVDKVRGTDKPTLGQIFQEIYDRREQRWIFDKEKRGQSGGTGGGAQAATADAARTKALENTVQQLRTQNAALKTKQLAPGGGATSKGAGKAGKRGQVGGTVPPSKKQRPAGKPVTLQAMHNGEQLCPGFNNGNCPKAQCKQRPPKAHKCNGQLPGRPGHACGGPHPSIECDRCERS